MPARTSQRRAPGLLLALALFAGCTQRTADPAPVDPAPPVPSGPGQIELSDARATRDGEKLVRFEVRYRFTRGGPSKYYLCEIKFPGTTNVGAKPMEKWELKAEGVIRDGIILHSPPVETFEIRVSETDSPQLGYKLISNVVRGTVK